MPKLKRGMELPDPIFRGGCGIREIALFSSWLLPKASILSDLPVVNERFQANSQSIKNFARCPKVENSVVNERSQPNSQSAAVCTKKRTFGATERFRKTTDGNGASRPYFQRGSRCTGSRAIYTFGYRGPGIYTFLWASLGLVLLQILRPGGPSRAQQKRFASMPSPK